MMSAEEALGRLLEGNRRYVKSGYGPNTRPNDLRRGETANERNPFAIILGCSDARVSPEIVFNQGPGELFVVRVAGNIVAPSQRDSIEFAAEQLGCRLIVVLGHSDCRAVAMTLEVLRQSPAHECRIPQSFVSYILSAIDEPLHDELGVDFDTLLRDATSANIVASVNQLRHGSELLQPLFQKGGLLVVGAEYSVETGVVEFLHSTEPV